MKEKVIVLRNYKWSESDLMVHTLNSSGAKMSFVARGALRSKKRFSGGILEPTHYILAHYQESRRSHEEEPLHLLQDAELIKGFNGIRDSYERIEVALAMVGVMAKVAQPGVEDATELFDLLGNGLFAVESSFHLNLLRLQFESKLLYLQGILPTHLQYAELLKRPLKEHSLIQLSPEEFKFLKYEVKINLERYLQGLGPMTTDSAEI